MISLRRLVIQHSNKVFLLQLVHSKIDSFSLLGHHFIHLWRDSIAEEIYRKVL